MATTRMWRRRGPRRHRRAAWRPMLLCDSAAIDCALIKLRALMARPVAPVLFDGVCGDSAAELDSVLTASRPAAPIWVTLSCCRLLSGGMAIALISDQTSVVEPSGLLISGGLCSAASVPLP